MLVLASQSPRRKELLERAGFAFTVRAPEVDEVRLPGEPPEAYVERLSRSKAFAVASTPVTSGDDEWILAADTVVVVDHHVLEKPADKEDARRMLRLLSARSHQVITGVCLRHGNLSRIAVETTVVYFRPLTPAVIDAYVESGEPNDKAGAYAIQGLASKFIPRIEGCYFNVVGLPVARVYELLLASGYDR